jgi:hypothetical protein
MVNKALAKISEPATKNPSLNQKDSNKTKIVNITGTQVVNATKNANASNFLQQGVKTKDADDKDKKEKELTPEEKKEKEDKEKEEKLKELEKIKAEIEAKKKAVEDKKKLEKK